MYYTGDNETHKSVTEYTVLTDGVVIAWHLLSHKRVTLSIIES